MVAYYYNSGKTRKDFVRLVVTAVWKCFGFDFYPASFSVKSDL